MNMLMLSEHLYQQISHLLSTEIDLEKVNKLVIEFVPGRPVQVVATFNLESMTGKDPKGV